MLLFSGSDYDCDVTETSSATFPRSYGPLTNRTRSEHGKFIKG